MGKQYIAMIARKNTENSFIVIFNNMAMFTTKENDIHVLDGLIVNYSGEMFVDDQGYRRNLSENDIRDLLLAGNIAGNNIRRVEGLINRSNYGNWAEVKDLEKELKKWAEYNITEAETVMLALNGATINITNIIENTEIKIQFRENTKTFIYGIHDPFFGEALFVPRHVFENCICKVLRKYNVGPLEEKSKRQSSNRTYHRKTNLITPTLRSAVLFRDKRCLCCGRTVADGVKLEVDHIVPVSMGGHTVVNNLQTLCSECNQGKGTHSYDFLHTAG